MNKDTKSNIFSRLALGVAVLMVFTFTAFTNQGDAQNRDDVCTETAEILFDACRAEVMDNSLKQEAICINISNKNERKDCLREIEDAQQESNRLCRQQRDLRLDACKSLGEDRYDPQINPATYDDDFAHLTNPNPYFPLTIGNRWEYHS